MTNIETVGAVSSNDWLFSLVLLLFISFSSYTETACIACSLLVAEFGFTYIPHF